MRVAVVGPRDVDLIERTLIMRAVASIPEGGTLVTTGSRGVGNLALVAAKARGLKIEVALADWGRDGGRAGLVRDRWLLDSTDRIIVIWDGRCRATRHLLSLARRERRPLEVVDAARSTVASSQGEEAPE